LRQHPDPESNVGGPPGRAGADGTPRWVKAFGAVALIAIAILALVHLAGGDMGHLSHGDMDAHAPPGQHTGHEP